MGGLQAIEQKDEDETVNDDRTPSVDLERFDIDIIAVTDFVPLKKEIIVSGGFDYIDTEYYELIKLRKIYFENLMKIVEKF